MPRIINIVDEAYDSCENGEIVEFSPRKLFTSMLGSMFFGLFFGCNDRKHSFNGEAPGAFANRLINDLSAQGLEPLTLLLGCWFLKLGLRKRDRDINRRLKEFRDFADGLITERIARL